MAFAASNSSPSIGWLPLSQLAFDYPSPSSPLTLPPPPASDLITSLPFFEFADAVCTLIATSVHDRNIVLLKDLSPLFGNGIRALTSASPFTIPEQLFRFVLRPHFVVSVCALYLVLTTATRLYVKYGSNRPAKSGSYMGRGVVIVHAIVLASFFALTVIALVRTVIVVWPPIPIWSTFQIESFSIHIPYITLDHAPVVADALCKLHGPRGFGNAVVWDPHSDTWKSMNPDVKLLAGSPDHSDLGRLWNEGLAFWGWGYFLAQILRFADSLFGLLRGVPLGYFDILYHLLEVATAWASVRYMNPALWVGLGLNSVAGFFLYTFRAARLLGIPVPRSASTILGISTVLLRFFSTTIPIAYLFLEYDIPTQISKTMFVDVLRDVVVTVDPVSSITQSVMSVTTTIVSATPAPLMRKLFLYAIGEVGMAERLDSPEVEPVQPIIVAAAPPDTKVIQKMFPEERTIITTEMRRVRCVDTPGQAFAIAINLIYVALFAVLCIRMIAQIVSFFLKKTLGLLKGSSHKGPDDGINAIQPPPTPKLSKRKKRPSAHTGTPTPGMPTLTSEQPDQPGGSTTVEKADPENKRTVPDESDGLGNDADTGTDALPSRSRETAVCLPAGSRSDDVASPDCDTFPILVRTTTPTMPIDDDHSHVPFPPSSPFDEDPKHEMRHGDAGPEPESITLSPIFPSRTNKFNSLPSKRRGGTSTSTTRDDQENVLEPEAESAPWTNKATALPSYDDDKKTTPLTGVFGSIRSSISTSDLSIRSRSGSGLAVTSPEPFDSTNLPQPSPSRIPRPTMTMRAAIVTGLSVPPLHANTPLNPSLPRRSIAPQQVAVAPIRKNSSTSPVRRNSLARSKGESANVPLALTLPPLSGIPPLSRSSTSKGSVSPRHETIIPHSVSPSPHKCDSSGMSPRQGRSTTPAARSSLRKAPSRQSLSLSPRKMKSTPSLPRSQSPIKDGSKPISMTGVSRLSSAKSTSNLRSGPISSDTHFIPPIPSLPPPGREREQHASRVNVLSEITTNTNLNKHERALRVVDGNARSSRGPSPERGAVPPSLTPSKKVMECSMSDTNTDEVTLPSEASEQVCRPSPSTSFGLRHGHDDFYSGVGSLLGPINHPPSVEQSFAAQLKEAARVLDPDPFADINLLDVFNTRDSPFSTPARDEVAARKTTSSNLRSGTRHSFGLGHSRSMGAIRSSALHSAQNAPPLPALDIHSGGAGVLHSLNSDPYRPNSPNIIHSTLWGPVKTHVPDGPDAFRSMRVKRSSGFGGHTRSRTEFGENTGPGGLGFGSSGLANGGLPGLFERDENWFGAPIGVAVSTSESDRRHPASWLTGV